MKLDSAKQDAPQTGRSPCGERGLKSRIRLHAVNRQQSLPVRGAWVEISVLLINLIGCFVAPRAGSVG